QQRLLFQPHRLLQHRQPPQVLLLHRVPHPQQLHQARHHLHRLQPPLLPQLIQVLRHHRVPQHSPPLRHPQPLRLRQHLHQAPHHPQVRHHLRRLQPPLLPQLIQVLRHHRVRQHSPPLRRPQPLHLHLRQHLHQAPHHPQVRHYLRRFSHPQRVLQPLHPP
ncbi:unnamed protein product, partial [Adineta ricciae]